MKTIRIFIGSSINDLEYERDKLVRFISGLDRKYFSRGIHFESYVCEESASAMQADGSQSIHDKYIENEADITVFMFWHKAGEYTMHELEVARNRFIAGGRPNVYVFFKAVDKKPDPSEDIQKCINIVFNGYGHYYKMFDDVDTVKLEILMAVSDLLPGKPEIVVTDGKVYLNKESVDNISAENVFAYQNNPDLKEMKGRIEQLKSEQVEASSRNDLNKALELSVKIDDLQKTYHELENDILKTLSYFTDENRKGKKANPRRMEALRNLEQGNIDAAKALISQEELDRRAQSLEMRENISEELFNDERVELIEDAIVRIQALKLDNKNSKRFDEIERVYDSVYSASKSVKAYGLIFEYASFLLVQNNFPKATRIAEKLEYMFNDPESDEEIEKSERSNVLNLLGGLYASNNDPEKAKKAYLDALDISRLLIKESNDPNSEEIFLQSCISLAAFYKKTRQLKEAEKLFFEARDIIDKNPCGLDNNTLDSYVSSYCFGLACLYRDAKKPEEAEKLFIKAIEISRRLAKEEDREMNEYSAAEACCSLAGLYSEMGKTKEAEDLYIEALETNRRLAREVSLKQYEPDVAHSCNSCAVFYTEIGKYGEAEKLLSEALEINRRLASEVSREAYEPEVAVVCNNLASLYDKAGMPKKAKELFLKALEINRRLASEVSREAYEPSVALTCKSFADFCAEYLEAKIWDAEDLYLEALEIYRKYAENVSFEAYAPDIASTCNSLANYYGMIAQKKEAQKLYLEAIGIYNRLSNEVNREMFAPFVAITYNNLASFYLKCGKTNKAKKNHLAALGIYSRLVTEISMEAYGPGLAQTYENLADDNKKKDDAIAAIFLDKALEIYRYLAYEAKCEAYEPNVASISAKLAREYGKTGLNMMNTKKLFSDALGIYRRFASEDGNEVNDRNVALTCSDFGLYYSQIGKVEEAEKMYVEAMEIFRRLAKDVSTDAYEYYLSKVCKRYSNLLFATGKAEEANKFLIESKEIKKRIQSELDIYLKYSKKHEIDDMEMLRMDIKMEYFNENFEQGDKLRKFLESYTE